MSSRDEFPKSVRTALALRANYRCSFCGRATSGPSDESPAAVASIGVAAHIHAASPGGKRYRLSMSSEERSSIENGIWLCATHGTLIDQDSEKFTATLIREMRRKHEAKVADEIGGEAERSEENSDLVALGPDVVFLGAIVKISRSEWQLRLIHFVIGDIGALIACIEGFSSRRRLNQYILVNSIGDGRLLTDPPFLKIEGSDYVIYCATSLAFPRIDAPNLLADMKVGPTNDLVVENGDIAMVSGVESLSQKIMLTLSVKKGELPFYPEAGSRLSEYYYLYHETKWLGRLIKLEIIRAAAIPIYDDLLRSEYTPLLCVNRVISADPLVEEFKNGRLPIRFDLDVKGLGRWQKVISVFLPIRPIDSVPFA